MSFEHTSYYEPSRPRAIRTLLVADIVESARLLEKNEAETLDHWLAIVALIESEILPASGGHLVKNLGDGVLLEFEQVTPALSVAFAIQRASFHSNVGRVAENHIMLRIGIEVADVLIAQHDVFGHGVNLAARLATLAGPGEIIVSARVREQLTPTLDAEVEDLGECYLKHIHDPVRAYRVGPPGPKPALDAYVMREDLRPCIAIVPFATQDTTLEYSLAGEVLAEELIRELSCSPDLSVISRLSTAAFRNRVLHAQEISAHLNAEYVLSGTYVVSNGSIRVLTELIEAKTARVLWAGQLFEPLASLVEGDREIVTRMVAEIRAAVTIRELQRVRSQSVPTLKSYSLLMAAVTLMHRMSLHDFEQAGHLLQSVIDRAKRQALPQAWLAHWFVLRVQQGWSADPKRDAWQALECTKQALDADPDCSLALAVDGLVQTHFLKRLDVAYARYSLAVERNPSDSLAWLLKGTMHAFRGEGRRAMDDTQRALKLSPLDPHRYYYDTLAGTACLAHEDWGGALRLADRSLRANRTHTSTLRVATIAAWRLGRYNEAHEIARRLIKLEPELTIRRYLARSPAAPFQIGRDWAEALRAAGIPA